MVNEEQTKEGVKVQVVKYNANYTESKKEEKQ